ncbi:MAG: hypothetical protein ABF891_09805, partial [Komagataeibacter saccharivorans]
MAVSSAALPAGVSNGPPVSLSAAGEKPGAALRAGNRSAGVLAVIEIGWQPQALHSTRFNAITRDKGNYRVWHIYKPVCNPIPLFGIIYTALFMRTASQSPNQTQNIELSSDQYRPDGAPARTMGHIPLWIEILCRSSLAIYAMDSHIKTFRKKDAS